MSGPTTWWKAGKQGEGTFREWGSRQTNQQKSAKNQDALNSIPSGL